MICRHRSDAIQERTKGADKGDVHPCLDKSQFAGESDGLTFPSNLSKA